MGTSSSYGGPTGRSPLLPPWAEDPTQGPILPSQEKPSPPPQLVPDLTWRAPKRAVGQLARGVAGGIALTSALRTLGRSYVQASGGSSTAATAAQAGRAATGRLGNFVAAGIRDGFAPTVERLGLQPLVGQDIQTVLIAFLDLLAPDGALLEEAAARVALIDTIEDIFNKYDVETKGIAALDQMDAVALGEVVELSVVNYVNARMLQELANRIERGRLSEIEANQLMDEICGFIGEIVKLDFSGVDLVHLDWDGPEGRRRVTAIYSEAYRLLGDEG